MNPTVTAVSVGEAHTFSKIPRDCIRLQAGLGVHGDVHHGATIRHRSRMARDPNQPNLRQVHLIHGELHDQMQRAGFGVAPGNMGENITTRGLDLPALPTGTRLHLGAAAVVEVTGLRTPCSQLDTLGAGLHAYTKAKDPNGRLLYPIGVMAVVITDGEVRSGDPILVELPPPPHRALAAV